MDPTATLQDLLGALEAREDAREHAYALSDWLAKEGALPEMNERTRRRVLNQLIRLAVVAFIFVRKD